VSKKIFFFLPFCLLLVKPAASDSKQPDLGSVNWAVTAPNNLKDHPPPNQAVWLFINEQGNPSVKSVSDLNPGAGDLCWFQFADLRGSGQLSLVAVYDGGGKDHCGDLSIFDLVSGEIQRTDYLGGPSFPDEKVQNVLKDINHDGRPELVVFHPTTDEGILEMALWPSIYAWTGAGYTDVSSQYPQYYRDWLASMKKEIAEKEKERQQLLEEARSTPQPGPIVVRTGGPTVFHYSQPAADTVQSRQESGATRSIAATPDYELDQKQALAAMIDRFLGSKDAGLTDAIRWANSKDPKERELAAQVFANMGVSKGLVYEHTLSHDADFSVAKFAHRRLKDWGTEQRPYDLGTGFEQAESTEH
jgi:hypothetical protein